MGHASANGAKRNEKFSTEWPCNNEWGNSWPPALAHTKRNTFTLILNSSDFKHNTVWVDLLSIQVQTRDTKLDISTRNLLV